MNPERTLDAFLEAVADDHRIYPAHISLYVTLFYSWKQQQYKNPLYMRREELMKRSRIAGRTTYQGCLRKLQEGGYIIYQPTFNRFENAKISVISPLSDRFNHRDL